MTLPIPQPPKIAQPSGLVHAATVGRGGTAGRLNAMHKPGTMASGGRNPFATPAKRAGSHTREMQKSVQKAGVHPQSDATLVSELIAALGLHPPQS